MKYLFITEEKWQEFADSITNSEYIYSNNEAQYGGLSVKGNSKAHTLCLLCMHLCRIVDAKETWNTFVRNNIPVHDEEERFDIPANDMKGSYAQNN